MKRMTTGQRQDGQKFMVRSMNQVFVRREHKKMTEETREVLWFMGFTLEYILYHLMRPKSMK